MSLHTFLDHTTKRLNKSVAIRASIMFGLSFAAVTLVIALCYLLRGHAAPLWGYLTGLGLAVLVTGISLVRNKVSRHKAAEFADQFYELKDGIVSTLHLASKEQAPMTELQADWTQNRLAQCDPKSIPLTFSRKIALLAGTLTVAVIGMAFIPPSPAVVAQQEQAQVTQERTTEAIDKIKDVVDEMERDLSKEERAQMEMSELRKMVDELKPTSKQKEAARQFAKMEQKARELSKSMQQKQDQADMKKAIDELQKSPQAHAKKLGKELKDDQIKRANEALQKLMPKQLPKKLSKKEVDAAKQQIEKLREVSKRLSSSASGASSGAAGAGAGSGGGLGAAMQGLDAQAKALSQQLKALELANLRQSKLDCQSFNQELSKLCKSCDKLCNKLTQCSSRKSCRLRLDSLCKNLSQCQSYCNSQCKSLSMRPCNGLKPGSASSDQRKMTGEELANNGNLSQLNGQKGAGPSLSKVEDAESGTGTSTQRTTAKAQNFERQMELFIQRDDVPEELKQGVKTYFQTIHQE